MNINDPFVLPVDVMLEPVEAVPEHLRAQFDYEPGDYVITRPRSRSTSQIIDADLALLLQEFRTPKTIVEAVIGYSHAKKADPEQILDEAFPVIRQIISNRLLLAEGSEEARRIQATLDPGDHIAGNDVLRCVQLLEDSEIYQIKRPDGRAAALKILRPGSREGIQPRLEREADILKHLDGRVNPSLLETGSFDGRYYLIIEWCPGADAFEIAESLRRSSGVDPQKKLLELCQAVLDAYVHLHDQHVIHSDIHPGNILVAGNGSVNIIDFGLAHLESGAEQPGRMERGGVSYFFEPECAKALLAGTRPPDSTTQGEQYSLAAMIYLLVTGLHYLDFSLEKKEMFRQIVQDPPLSFARRGIKSWPDLENILCKALRKNPAERFSSVFEFVQMLKKITPPDEHGYVTRAGTCKSVDTSALRELLRKVLQRTGLSGPLLPVGLKAAPTSSITYGAAGIAYGLYHIACVQNNPALLSLADVWGTIAAREIKSNEGFYADTMDITPASVGQISPYHTASGIYAVQALIGHAMGDLVSQQLALESFIASVRSPCDKLDLTLGRSGVLLVASLLLDALPPQDLLQDTALRQLGNETLLAIWKEIDRFAPVQECPELPLLGMSHGWAGILYATLRWCQSSGSALPTNLKSRLQQLAECAEHKGRGVHWKWGTQKLGNEWVSYYMPGWCNGSAGFVYLWTLARQIFDDQMYLSLAEKAAWNAWEESETNGTLCCGLAGQAYALLHFYKHTNQSEWLLRAQELANMAAVHITELDSRYTKAEHVLGIRPDSLYKGEIGVAVLAADLTRPEMSCLPFFEAEGWPVGLH
jgi:eukaryotic-like serine/threonine-protein kinase